VAAGASADRPDQNLIVRLDFEDDTLDAMHQKPITVAAVSVLRERVIGRDLRAVVVGDDRQGHYHTVIIFKKHGLVTSAASNGAEQVVPLALFRIVRPPIPEIGL
jgi:hypothetical protein